MSTFANFKIEIAEGLADQISRHFPSSLLEIITNLHNELEPERQNLLKDRDKRQKDYDSGTIPNYTFRSDESAIIGWKIAELPADLLCRRVEITGPVNSPKMVINMLNRNADGHRADMAMLDFEDSMMPSWPNVLDGYDNVRAAASGNLSFEQKSSKGKSKNFVT